MTHLRAIGGLFLVSAVGLAACGGGEVGGQGSGGSGGLSGGGTTTGGTGGIGTGASGGAGGAGGVAATGGTAGAGECSGSETTPCYEGTLGTEGVGACKAGQRACVNGSWGACTGQVLPNAPETCDGQDDDCDGLVDEEFGQTTCGQGLCQVTVQDCVGGVPNPCQPKAASPTEQCDGVDDDCDGSIDEGCSCLNGKTQPCYSGPAGTQGKGLCKGGTQTCTNGAWGACVGEVTPETELCNGLDDDCDGVVDDGSPQTGQPCNTGKLGECAVGTGNCVSPNLICNQNKQPSTEVCDGKDNDCDGQTDEGNPGGGASCQTGLLGVCAPGTMTCTNGAVSCVQNVNKGPELCDNLDNDCDGQVDENCKCPAGTTQSCYTGPANTQGVGICKPGSQTCANNGNWGPCTGEILPATESCNNSTDDDCDGQVNEGCGTSGPRIMFVTLNEGHTGNLGGLAGANALCASQASAASMPGTWKAFLSTSTQNVKDLFIGTDASLPVVNKANVVMHSTWSAIFTSVQWTNLQYAQSFKGQVVDEITVVSPPWTDADGWHGSNADGTVGANCNNWTSADSTVTGTGGEWDFYRLMTSGTVVESHACSYTAAVGCVSKQL